LGWTEYLTSEPNQNIEIDEPKHDIDNRTSITITNITYEQSDKFDGLFIHYHITHDTTKKTKIFKAKKYFRKTFNSYWFKYFHIHKKFIIDNEYDLSEMFINLINEISPMLNTTT